MGVAVFPPYLLPEAKLSTHASTRDTWKLTGKADSVSLLWEHWSFLLAPSVHKVLFVPSNNLFH